MYSITHHSSPFLDVEEGGWVQSCKSLLSEYASPNFACRGVPESAYRGDTEALLLASLNSRNCSAIYAFTSANETLYSQFSSPQKDVSGTLFRPFDFVGGNDGGTSSSGSLGSSLAMVVSLFTSCVLILPFAL